MNKAEFREKRKKLLEQRVRPTEGTEAVSAWDYDFNDSNEVLQSGEVELLENMTPIVPEDRPKTGEIFKEKRNKARHKLDAPILSEQLSDYPGSLNARDAVPPMVLMMDDVPDDVQKSTLSDPVSLPTPEPAIKKVSKAQSLVELAEKAKKRVHIISYGNTLYYYNNYYYTQLDAKQLIKLYRKYVDYELNNESSLHGYKDLYDCFMTDPKIECNEPEDEPIYAPLKNGVFELVEWKLHPHSPDQVTFTYIKAKYAPKATCPIFEGYLHRVTGGDPQLMERFWMVIGYLFIYPARGKFFIFMKGVGNSGKSVLGSFIRRLYPKESISSIRLKNLTNQFGMASLATSVINFDMDMPSSRIDDEAASRLKQITGGDSMNIPRKYRDDALLERRIKFVFSSNHPLIIDGEDEALMKRIVSTLNLPKEDWLRYRKCGITGTDAGSILGLNPYRSAFQVYHDKTSDTIENIDNEAMRQGRDLEEYVAQRFTEATDLKVRRANAIYQSEEHPLLLADFDRLIVGQKAGLECKTVSPLSADKWADGKIPAHYLAQVDHYLAVSGFDCWYVAALIFGRELMIHKIVTDKQVLSDLIDKEELFWTNHVVPQIPPAPNGCDCDTQQINQMYEVDDRDKTADLSALHGLLDKRQELSTRIEQMEQEKTAIEQQVKLKMQDAAYGTAPGYKVSWVSSESKRVDSQRLKKEQPDIFNRYSKNVSSRRFTIVHAA